MTAQSKQSLQLNPQVAIIGDDTVQVGMTQVKRPKINIIFI
jgi:hypothetical protein